MTIKRARLTVLAILALSTFALGQGTTTPRLGLFKPNAGSTGWSSNVNAGFDSLDLLAPTVLTKTTDYTLSSGDTGATVVFNCSIACTATVPDSLPATWVTRIASIGAGALSITRQTSATIDGLTTALVLSQYQGVSLFSNGSNAYYSVRGAGLTSFPLLGPDGGCSAVTFGAASNGGTGMAFGASGTSVLLAVQGACYWQLTSTGGHLIPTVDNASDLGSATLGLRHVWVKTDINTPLLNLTGAGLGGFTWQQGNGTLGALSTGSGKATCDWGTGAVAQCSFNGDTASKLFRMSDYTVPSTVGCWWPAATCAFPSGNSTQSMSAMTANRIYVIEIYVDKAIPITKLALDVTGATTGTVVCDAGFYNPSTGNAIIRTTTGFTWITAAGAKTATVATTTLGPNQKVWYAWTCSAADGTGIYSGEGGGGTFLNLMDAQGTVRFGFVASTTATAGVLPATITTTLTGSGAVTPMQLFTEQ